MKVLPFNSLFSDHSIWRSLLLWYSFLQSLQVIWGIDYLECSFPLDLLTLSWYPLHNPFGSSEERIWTNSSSYPSETSDREVSTHCILSLALSGCSRKGFGQILLWISLALSFGNPQPRGFNPLYPLPGPFGLFEERIRADFFPEHPHHNSLESFEVGSQMDADVAWSSLGKFDEEVLPCYPCCCL
jgi:hypothetical protein